MNKILIICLAILFCFTVQTTFAQIPIQVLVQISKAEDELRYDKGLEDLMKNPNEKIRQRATLAAGRIGNEKAIPMLTNLLLNDAEDIRATAAFALGEIESIKAADTILKVLKDTKNAETVRARAIEAAGKIAAANGKDEKAKNLGEAILDALQFEDNRGAKQSRDVILLGITAVLRAKPEEGDFITAKFLTNMDARIRADAANTLARLRAKNANEQLRAMLLSDDDAIVRANAARALGAAEDKEAFNLLLEAATEDEDLRVRISAIRSLGILKEEKVKGKLLLQARKLIIDYASSKKTFNFPKEKSEFLEIATTFGRIIPNTNDAKVVSILEAFNQFDKYQSPEIEIASAQITPSKFLELQRNKKDFLKDNWRAVNAKMAGIGELANATNSAEIAPIKEQAKAETLRYIHEQLTADNAEDKTLSDALSAYAAFKTADLPQVLRDALQHKGAIVRATVSGLLAEMASSPETIDALKKAFIKSLLTDKWENDAQLAILSALVKLDKAQAVSSLKLAFNAPDFLVRRHASQLIKQNDLIKSFPNTDEKVGTIKSYNLKTKTKLGQILNTQADYVRAVSRKNAKAILTTKKGTFTIQFLPEDAPLTVDNFIKLARSGYFNNVAIHRVVPNFVMQDGDPRGDGNGGPGWQIRDEINIVPYERGTVGMALSGKDTGGSQWFVTHSPQPHLDGGYTVFGKVNETDMKIVDNLVRGDKILSVKIVEGKLPVKKENEQ